MGPFRLFASFHPFIHSCVLLGDIAVSNKCRAKECRHGLDEWQQPQRIHLFCCIQLASINPITLVYWYRENCCLDCSVIAHWLWRVYTRIYTLFLFRVDFYSENGMIVLLTINLQSWRTCASSLSFVTLAVNRPKPNSFNRKTVKTSTYGFMFSVHPLACFRERIFSFVFGLSLQQFSFDCPFECHTRIPNWQ